MIFSASIQRLVTAAARWSAAPILALAVLAPAGHAQVVQSKGEDMALEVGKGALVRLPAPTSNIFIADSNIADVQVKSPRLVYVFGKKPGDTTLYAVGNNDEVIYNATVRVSHNISRVNDAIQEFMPNANVSLKSVKGTLVMTGNVDSSAKAADLNQLALELVGDEEKIMNRVQVAGPSQVNLRVKVAEVSRNVVKELGFNWQSTLNGSNTFFGIATGRQVFEQTVDPITGMPVRNFLLNSGDGGSYVGSWQTGNLDLNTLIDALNTNGLVSILAEPNLTAMSGETASFLAGGEFPIPVPQAGSDGGSTITIEYKNFGVGLAFTPTVMSDKRINLKVAPEVSQLSSAGALVTDGFSVPSLTTRRAETTVELGSGQSFAIAGLLQNNINRSVSKFPGLGDIPILGQLFRSDRFERNETELVIVVTPYIVNPVSKPQMAAPTDGLKAPSDHERLIEGQMYKPQPLQEKPATQGAGGERLIGTAGFILD